VTPRELPDYLRPLPGPGGEPSTERSPEESAPPAQALASAGYAGEAAAAAPATAPDQSPAATEGPPGLVRPRSRGHSGAFITDVIVELDYATREAVDSAIAQARTAGRAPEEILIEQGLLDQEKLARAVAERYGLDFVDLAVFQVDMGAASLISVRSARRHRAVPVHYIDEETLLVAMADPTNVVGIDDVQMATGLSCRVAVAPAADVDALINRLTTLQSTVTEAIEDVDEAEHEEEAAAEVTDLRASAQDAPVIKLVNSILGQAVSEGASDIHFEHGDSEMRIRFRIDGVLHEAARVPKRMVSGVVSRIKNSTSPRSASPRTAGSG
jgi:type IV pilus assembly protein PilB